MPVKLDHGYYWISYRGMEPCISRWDGMFWWGDGAEGTYTESEVRVLSKRQITPPVSVVRRAKKQANEDPS